MVSFTTLKKSFGYAFEGVIFALKHNQNLRIHFFVALIVIFVSAVLKVNSFEAGILGIMILLVVCTEMINTAIEEMVNFVTLEHKREAKIAKDVAAGMVLLTVVGSIVVGFLIFTPYVLRYLNR